MKNDMRSSIQVPMINSDANILQKFTNTELLEPPSTVRSSRVSALKAPTVIGTDKKLNKSMLGADVSDSKRSALSRRSNANNQSLIHSK